MAESSEASGVDVKSLDTGSSPESQDVAAESSTADEGVKAPASPLEAVKAALESSAEEDSKGQEKPATESTPRETDTKDTKVSNVEEELGEDKNFSKEANRRIRTLVEKNNAFKAETEVLRKDAEAFRQVSERFRSTGASAQQINDAVQFLALFNQDPAKAFEMLSPVYQQLESFVGNRLPADLQEKVDGGYMDEDSARELAKLRNVGQFTQTRHQQVMQQQQQVQQQESFNGLKNAIGQASTDWESEWKSSDPDYQRKMPFVMAEIKAQIAERGGISSPQEAVDIANAALKNVNDNISSMLPRREIKTVTGGFQSGNAAPKPRSAIEAARLALNR